MYVYQITNIINNKKYIGITNNPKKRWENHKCNNDPSMVIARAIKKYGKENFKFEILYLNLSIEEASDKEIELIRTLNTKVPNGYNVADGGLYKTANSIHVGADNGMAKLTNEEAQYIKDHRDLPMYVLYELFNTKISYDAFKKCYKNLTYKNLIPKVKEYPYNMQFSNLFLGKLEYDEIISLREQYANGVYWKLAYEDYKNKYTENSFWRVYTGLSYKLVMPEVFTEENKKKHASFRSSGTNNNHNKLSIEEVKDIRNKHNNGVSNSELYKLYDKVSPSTIRRVIDYTTWKNLI